MADEIASLGFAVDSQQLDAAKQKLRDLSTEADNTGQAVDKFNQSAVKTGASLGGAVTPAKDLSSALKDGATAATGYVGPIAAIEAAAKRSSVSYAEMESRIKGTAAAFLSGTQAVNGASAAHDAASHSVKGLAEGFAHLSTAIALNESPTRGLTSLFTHLSSAAGEEGGITGAFAGLARFIGPTGLIIGGLAATGAAFLAIDHAIASTSQEVEKSKSRFDALGGATLGDQYSRGLKQLTDDLGVTRAAVQPTLEALLKLDLPMFGQAKISAKEAADAISVVFQELRLGDVDTKTATKEVGAFFDELIKKQGLTGDALKKLQDISPQAANAIAVALGNGAGATSTFIAQLNKVPASIDDTRKALALLKPSSDAAFKSLLDNPQNVSDALSKVGRSFSVLWDGITGADKSSEQKLHFDALTIATNAFANALTAATPGFVKFSQDADAAFVSAVQAVSKFNKDGTEQLRQFNESAIEFLRIRDGNLANDLAQADADIIKFAQSANASFASIAQSAGGALSAIGQVAAAVANGSPAMVNSVRRTV